MRLSFLPYTLTHEDALRLCRILARQWDGKMTLRDLERRRGVRRRVIDACDATGFIRIEKQQPHTGRPSLIVVLSPNAVNKCHSAKLPFRADQPKPLSFREEEFLSHYAVKRGRKYLEGRRGGGSAADAYRLAYGRHRHLTRGSSRSAGARLARQPWMRVAFRLERKLMGYGGRTHWPADLRSHWREWQRLLAGVLDRWGDLPPAPAQIIRHARTCAEAQAALKRAAL